MPSAVPSVRQMPDTSCALPLAFVVPLSTALLGVKGGPGGAARVPSPGRSGGGRRWPATGRRGLVLPHEPFYLAWQLDPAVLLIQREESRRFLIRHDARRQHPLQRGRRFVVPAGEALPVLTFRLRHEHLAWTVQVDVQGDRGAKPLEDLAGSGQSTLVSPKTRRPIAPFFRSTWALSLHLRGRDRDRTQSGRRPGSSRRRCRLMNPSPLSP